MAWQKKKNHMHSHYLTSAAKYNCSPSKGAADFLHSLVQETLALFPQTSPGISATIVHGQNRSMHISTIAPLFVEQHPPSPSLSCDKRTPSLSCTPCLFTVCTHGVNLLKNLPSLLVRSRSKRYLIQRSRALLKMGSENES